MKRTVLSGIAFTAALCAGTAFAQTSAINPTSTPGQSSSAQAITMSGCVANATSGTRGFTLSNPIVLPSGSGISSASGIPSSSATAGSSSASTGATQPPTSTPLPTSTPPPSTPPASATAGTSGTTRTSATRPTGTTGSATAGTVGAAGTSASSSAFNGYRLSGADLAQYAGKRVEVTGTFAPSSSANSTASASGVGATTLQEFHVTSAKPIGGACQQ